MKRKRSNEERWNFPDEIEMLVAFLNNGKYRVARLEEDVLKELRALVDEWLNAKASWHRFLESRLKARKPVPFFEGTFRISAQAQTPFMIPSASKDATEAQGIFLRFILNPDHKQLAGPCLRKACGRYFLRKTAHPKVYCSSRCASLNSAIDSMKRKREKIQEGLIGEAQKAVAQWSLSPLKRISWEDWVAGKVTEWAENEALLNQKTRPPGVRRTGRALKKIKTREVTARMIRGWVKRDKLKAPKIRVASGGKNHGGL